MAVLPSPASASVAGGGVPATASPTSASAPASVPRTSSAAAPVTPSTGAATRPAGIDGSGRSRGSASSTARAPAAAAAAAWPAGSSPARTTASFPRRLFPFSSSAGSVASTGPAVVRPGRRRRAGEQRGAAGVDAAELQVDPRDGGRRGERADGEGVRRGGGRADRPARPGRGALAARGRDHQRPEVGRAGDRLRLGRVLEARVGRVDADDGDRHVVVRGAVAVRVDGALEPGQQRVRDRHVLQPGALRGGLEPGDADRQHALPGRDEDARERGPARLAATAARVGGGRGVAVAVDRVVAAVEPVGEQRMALVDARCPGPPPRPRRAARRRWAASRPGSARARSWRGRSGARAGRGRRATAGRRGRPCRRWRRSRRTSACRRRRRRGGCRGRRARCAARRTRPPATARRSAGARGRRSPPRRATGAGARRSRGCRGRSARAASARRTAWRRRAPAVAAIRLPPAARPRRPPRSAPRRRRR